MKYNKIIYIRCLGIGVLVSIFILHLSGCGDHVSSAPASTSSKINTDDNKTEPIPELGLENSIPFGWQALRQDGNVVNLYQKQLDFHDSILPRDIVIKEQSVLTRQIDINLTIGGQLINLSKLKSKTVKFSERSSERVAWFDAEGLSVVAKTKIHFDGFLEVELMLWPRQATTIESLEVDVPLDSQAINSYSKYLAYDYNLQKVDIKDINNSTGNISDGFSQSFEFNPAIWLGKEGAGIEWVAETNLNYANKNLEEVHSITANNNEILFKTKIIDQSTVLSSDLKYSFGFFLTPSREKKTAWKRDYLVSGVNSKIASEIQAQRPNMNMLYLGSWVRTPTASPGLPSPENTPKSMALYNRLRAELSDNGIKYLPYSTLYIMASTDKALLDKLDAWAAAPKRKGNSYWTTRLKTSRPVQPITLEAPSVRKYLLDKHLESLRTFNADGIYFDVAQFWDLSLTRERFLEERAAGGELTGANSREHVVFYPMFSHYRFVQEFWQATKGIKNDFVIVHHSGSNVPRFSAAYTDIVVVGESYYQLFQEGNLKTRPSGKKRQWLRPAKYKPDYSILPEQSVGSSLSQSDGFSYMLLPQVVKYNEKYLEKNPDKYKHWSISSLAYLFENELLLWDARIDRMLVTEFVNHMSASGAYGDDVQFQDCHFRHRPEGIRSCKYIKNEDTILLYLFNNSDKLRSIKLGGTHFKFDEQVSFVSEGDSGLARKLVSVDVPANEYLFKTFQVESK